jgi:hypothetical protein
MHRFGHVAVFDRDRARRGLAHDCVGYLEPVRQVAYHRVHDDGLAKDESGKPAEVDLVDAPVDDQVSRYTEHNQEVHAGIKQDR